MSKTQIDMLLEKYKNHLTTITKEQEKVVVNCDDFDFEPINITLELTKKMTKLFIKYYNLVCLYEYLDDSVMLTEHYPEQEEKHKKYCKELKQVRSELSHLKNKFYTIMANGFLNHNVTEHKFADEGLGYSDVDLMTLWAEEVQNQIEKLSK